MKITILSLILFAVYLLLLIPEGTPEVPETSDHKPFIWNQDSLWSSLEANYRAVRAQGCLQLKRPIDSAVGSVGKALDSIETKDFPFQHPIFDRLENAIFKLAPMAAACPECMADLTAVTMRTRTAIKRQLGHWNIQEAAVRQRLYRLIYGSRTALEEAMLQVPLTGVPELIPATDEPSQTPEAEVLGVTLHSGDILVSRGGAPTSALIARGNDFPGNFSHVALVHIDDSSHAISMIEAHIEKGVAIASWAEYIADKKLRVLVLRLRSDLPEIKADPMLPHKAATEALDRARAGHTAYDFEMNFHDHRRLFCSEVASSVYEARGVTLWMGLSHISSRGAKQWLTSFGAKYFETQEPADLEYDPQLSVVAEWRGMATLYQDHLDNAVIDVMLEGADRGETLPYPIAQLPLVRLVKAYSVLLNKLGKVGPVPEGMSATAALRNQVFTETHHAIRDQVMKDADIFHQKNGYVPPQWELLKLARHAKEALGK